MTHLDESLTPPKSPERQVLQSPLVYACKSGSIMATISTQNKLARQTPSQTSDAAIGLRDDDEKEPVLERGSLREDQDRHSTADVQKDAQTDDAKSFLRYDERHW